MRSYDEILKTDEETERFIQSAEHSYFHQIEAIADRIAKVPDLRFLTLAGPSCSGKTTTSHLLRAELRKKDIPVTVISIDDFYRNQRDIENYESAEAIDLPALKRFIDDVEAGKDADAPLFDFVSGVRSGWKRHTLAPREIVLFEGIQALYLEITCLLPKNAYLSVFISVGEDVRAYGTDFSKREIRFFRRLLRDFLFRNATPHRTLSLWKTVVENEEKNILPAAANAHFSIDSFLLYELNVIKPFLLQTVQYDPTKADEAALYRELREKFQKIPTIDEKFVPENSVFREFIGEKKGKTT